MRLKLWINKKKWLFLLIIFGLFIVIIVSNFLFSFFIILNKKYLITLKNIFFVIKENENNSVLYFNLIIIVLYAIFWIVVVIFEPYLHQDYVSETQNTIFGSANWLTKKEFNKNYPLVTLENPYQNYGIVVNFFETKTNVFKVNVRSGTHTIVVAGTRSGKTQCIVIPTLQLFARSKSQCSLIVSDPKGELFETNSKIFEDNGYDVIKLDFRNPELSVCWNPLSVVFENWVIGCELEQKYNFNVGLNNSNKSVENNNVEEYYKYQQKAIDYISDICATLFPVNDPKEKFWYESAAGVLKGILLGILYDMKDKNKFDKNRFNLSSIIPLINNKDELMKYFGKLDIAHPARIAISGLIDGSQETSGSILQTLKAELEKFSDPVLRTLFSKTGLKLSDIFKKPTVIFLVVPDDRTDRHVFASLFITQSYKMLIELASLLPNKKLEKPFYYVLDEFANIPKIPEMGAKISVSGGRNIWWLLIIQDKPQLIDKYGDNVAKTINNNCNMHIFLQTMDLETARYYSDIIGERTIILKTRSNRTLGKYKNSEQDGTRSLNHVPLIKASDLMQLKFGEGIVIFSREKPAKIMLIPMWKCSIYVKGSINEKLILPLTNKQFSDNYVYPLWCDENHKKKLGNSMNNIDIFFEKERVVKIERKVIEIEDLIYNKYSIEDENLKQDLLKKINEIYDLIYQK